MVIQDDVSVYSNLFGFLGAPLSADVTGGDADVAVLGVPYDLGTTGRAGTRSGPTAIRQASGNLRWEEARWPWRYALADHLKMVDCGDLIYPPGDSAAFSHAVPLSPLHTRRCRRLTTANCLLLHAPTNQTQCA